MKIFDSRMERIHPSSINGPSSSHASLHWAVNGPGHAVHFYEDDDCLARVVVNFLADGLSVGQPVLSIATKDHTELFARGLKARGFDLPACETAGVLVRFDAQQMLDQFMTGDTVDHERFRMIVGRTLERAGGRRRMVRGYGEMVDLLWKEGNVVAAIELERAWNALASTFHFALLCGYAVGHFRGGQHLAAFEDVCGEHHHVIPTDRRCTPRVAGR